LCLLVFSSTELAQAETVDVWREAEINTYIKSYSPFAKRLNDDPFSAGVTPAPSSKVLIEYPVTPLRGRDADPDPEDTVESYFSYDTNSGVLKVDLISVQRGLSMLDVEKGGFKGYYGYYDEFREYEEGWVTRFETTRNVVDPFDPAKKASRIVEKYGIAEFVGYASPDTLVPPLNGLGYQPVYRFEASLAPDDARKLAEKLAFRISAKTKPWTSGEWIVCHENWKLDGFVESQYFDECFLTVEVETVTLVDLNTGEILKSWPGRFTANQPRNRVPH
jgi:hypothetical protein